MRASAVAAGAPSCSGPQHLPYSSPVPQGHLTAIASRLARTATARQDPHMLIHPWDRATRQEWRDHLARHDFGQLVTAGHVDGYPVVVPTHFLHDGGDTVELHLARPNPVWQ